MAGVETETALESCVLNKAQSMVKYNSAFLHHDSRMFTVRPQTRLNCARHWHLILTCVSFYNLIFDIHTNKSSAEVYTIQVSTHPVTGSPLSVPDSPSCWYRFVSDAQTRSLPLIQTQPPYVLSAPELCSGYSPQFSHHSRHFLSDG